VSRHRPPRGARTVLLAVVLAALPAAAEESPYRLSARASLRELVVASGQTDPDGFADALARSGPDAADDVFGEDLAIQSSSRLRLRLDGGAGEHLRALVVWDHFADLGHLDTLESDLAAPFATGSRLGAEWTLVSGARAAWRQRLNRGYVAWEGRHLEVVVGRQRVAWGVGRLWNPIDRFNTIPPLAFEGDETVGVDAALLRWNFGGFSFVEAVYAATDERVRDRYAVRAHAVTLDTDWSVFAGRFEGALSVGGDLERNLGDAAFHTELLWSRPGRDFSPTGGVPGRPEDFVQCVVSVDHQVDWHGAIYLLGEYFYNGNGLGLEGGAASRALRLGLDARDALAGSQLATFAEHLLGAQMGRDVGAQWRIDLLTLVDPEGRSAVLAPRVAWVPLDALEVALGIQGFVGPRESEYGDRAPVGFLLAEWFF